MTLNLLLKNFNITLNSFVLTVRSSFNFVVFDLLLIELLPFAKISFSGLSFPVLIVILTWHFGRWICLDIMQIKFDFYCVWPDCTPDIFFCLNLFFRFFLCRLARYWHQIWGMNLYWRNTGNFHFCILSCILSGVMPLWNLMGPVGDMYCFSNTYSMLVWTWHWFWSWPWPLTYFWKMFNIAHIRVTYRDHFVRKSHFTIKATTDASL